MVAGLVAAAVVPTLALGGVDADVEVRLAVSPQAVTVGDDVRIVATVTNSGTEPAPDVTLTLTPPTESVVLSSVSREDCVPASEATPPGTQAPRLQDVTCPLGSVDPGPAIEVTLAVSVVAHHEQGHLVVAARVSSPTDPDPGNDEDQASVEVGGQDCTRWGTQGPEMLTADEGGSVLCGLGGADLLIGGPGPDVLYGGTGPDHLQASSGQDVLDGGQGRDTVSYLEAPRGIVADLAARRAQGWGVDVLQRVEDLVGSAHDDVLLGDGRRNRLEGRGGSDILRGRAGPDVLVGGGGADFLHGGRGRATLDGGPGDDICIRGPGGGTLTRCHPRHPRDPRDTRGMLDVARVRSALGSRRPVWSIRTYGRWGTRPIWDRGYLIVWLDTRGGPQPNHYALVRSTGGGVTGILHRVRPGRDVAIGTVPTWRPSNRSISVRVPLSRLNIGPSRRYFRWGVQSLFTGQGCGRVCFDRVPGASRMFIQPLP